MRGSAARMPVNATVRKGRGPAKRPTIRLVRDRALPALTLIAAVAGIGLGCLSLSLNSLEAYPVPVLSILAALLALLLLRSRRSAGTWERRLLVLSGLAVISAVVLRFLPEHSYGFYINAVFHRSFFSALLLLAVSVPATSAATYHLLGATPRAEDLSCYPLILFPVALTLGAYAILLYHVVSSGLPHLDWDVLSTSYQNQSWQVKFYENDWPVWRTEKLIRAGMLNHILGTFVLMGLTALISLPIGVGAGIYIGEYYDGWVAKVVRFSAGALRAISVFILAMTALTLVRATTGTPLSDIFAGYYIDVNGNWHPAHGSMFTASIFLSLLVIPIIARATEEGIRSVPRDLREGSLALAASDSYTLRRIVLPWALPNIVTALLLSCAEAGGNVAVLLFMAGNGEFGIGPLNEVTSLGFLIFEGRLIEVGTFKKLMGDYQFTAALLLLVITMGLSMAAIILKRRFASRYRLA
ncbi:MAG: PstA family ABC transporter permease [Chloroflexota bacterium]